MEASTRRARSSGEDPDDLLVAQARKELPYVDSSYTKLMTRHELLMFHVAQRLVDNPEDAREVVQEAMVKIFHNLQGFKGNSTFKTWILQILRNQCISFYRKNRKFNQQTDLEGLGKEELMSATADHTESSDAKMDALRILGQLDFTDRQILVLRFVADLDLAEIAQILKLGLSATKMRLYRALEKANDSVKE